MAILIWVLNFLDLFFTQFFDILNHEAREKEKFLLLENLVKFLKDEKLWIKNQGKASAIYAKQLIKRKVKFSVTGLKTSRIPQQAYL